tara:strand:+ start:444 stop:662 length:219 start_codon:yes stop_codon:yes gene_type:complete
MNKSRMGIILLFLAGVSLAIFGADREMQNNSMLINAPNNPVFPPGVAVNLLAVAYICVALGICRIALSEVLI